MKKILCLFAAACIGLSLAAQDFEEKNLLGEEFESLKVRIGADFALQYQALEHYSDSVTLIPLGKGINLPTANLVTEAYLAPGIKVNLTTYLSSRHHVEAWVKGGYLLIDELPFLHSGLFDRIMNFTSIKVGVMELNFGDAHFRRSDNGNVLHNRFVGNPVMESFTTAPAAEFLFRQNGWLLMMGVNGGSLKPALSAYSASTGTYTAYNMAEELAFHWKAGFDKSFTQDLRIRGSLSGFHNANHHFGSLYYGDRTGSRYYLVMKAQTGSADDVDPASGHTSGNWGPGFTDKNNALAGNLFLRYKGIEVFGDYEHTRGTSAFGGSAYEFTQILMESLVFFGKEDQFFSGARYNKVFNQDKESILRYQIAAGWYLTENIAAKLEYVHQQYIDFSSYKEADAGFKGFMFEAAISF